MAKNKKKGQFGLFVTAVLVSLAITVSLTPVMRLIYPLKYENEIIKCAEKFALDEYLVMAIISAESNFVPDAVSNKSAVGLMQIKKDTAKWCLENLSVEADAENLDDPGDNISLGCSYIKYLTELYDGNLSTAIAAYNAGPGTVKKWLADKRYSAEGKTLIKIPYSETEQYVKKVEKRMEIYRIIYDKEYFENSAQK